MKKLALTILFTLLASHAWATTYFLAPATAGGNDSNNGTSASTPWLTPNHALNCGDVIIRAAGSSSASNFRGGNWGTVSNCPSTVGVYFAILKCAGPYVTSCSISASDGNDALTIDKSNWAIIGGMNSTTNGGGCFNATPSGEENIRYVAFINVFANGCYSDGIGATG